MTEDVTEVENQQKLGNPKSFKNKRLTWLVIFLVISIALLIGVFGVVYVRDAEKQEFELYPDSNVTSEKLLDKQRENISTATPSISREKPKEATSSSQKKSSLKYSDKTFNFSFDYPGDWNYTYSEIFNAKNHLLRFVSPSNLGPTLLISETSTYQSMYDSIVNGLSKGQLVISIDVDGRSGSKLYSNYTLHGQNYKSFYYIWTNEGTLFTLSGIPEFDLEMESIINSFKFNP